MVLRLAELNVARCVLVRAALHRVKLFLAPLSAQPEALLLHLVSALAPWARPPAPQPSGGDTEPRGVFPATEPQHSLVLRISARYGRSALPDPSAQRRNGIDSTLL